MTSNTIDTIITIPITARQIITKNATNTVNHLVGHLCPCEAGEELEGGHPALAVLHPEEDQDILC